MLRLDPTDPLDRMILRELGGNTVSFDEWLDAMEELEDEPDCAQILQNRGLRRETVLREASEYRTGFLKRLTLRNLPTNDRFALCRLLSEQAQMEPSAELQYLYCEVLSDPGFLLNQVPQNTGDDFADYEEQVILQYLDFADERDQLFHTVTQIRDLAEQFAEVKKQNRSPRPADCDTERKYEILQCFTKLYDFPKRGSGQVLLDNLSAYMQIAAASPVLKSVEPLLLFRLLTRRQSYMCSTPDLSVNLSALWKSDQNKIDTDNGRNFKQCRTNLEFFANLCRIYKGDNKVNFALCWYGLDQITVLGSFYRNKPSLVGSGVLPFISTIADVVESSVFSCFENGYGDNVVLEDSGISVRELLNFQCSTNPVIVHSLNKISDYMNDHAIELTEGFLYAPPEDVKSLCRNILADSELKSIISARNLPLYLASINEGLMDLQDYFANQYLTQAGCALTAVHVTKSPEQIE